MRLFIFLWLSLCGILANAQHLSYNRFSIYTDSTLNSFQPHPAINFGETNGKRGLSALPILNSENALSVKADNFLREEIGAAFFYSSSKLNVSLSYVYGLFQPTTFELAYATNYRVFPQYGKLQTLNDGSWYQTQQILGDIHYTPWEFISVSLGNNRVFLGNGYRSNMISDAQSPYPFVKIDTKFGRNFRYLNLFSMYLDQNPYNPPQFSNRKFSASHYLSLSLGKRLNLGLFESVIWGARDTFNNRGFDVNYLNPFVFYRPVEYSIGSSDNSILGMDARLNLTKSAYLYGQFVIDEFLLSEIKARNGWWANKYAVQAGAFASVKIKQSTLFMRAEYNMIRPYTFTHARSEESYTHFNQSLAHPLGANFKEAIGILAFKTGRFLLETKGVYYIQGVDLNATNFGSNILKSYITREEEYGNFIGQGKKKQVAQMDVLVMYEVVKSKPYYLSFSSTYRKDNILGDNLYLCLGFNTLLWNRYNDYF